MKAQRGVVVNSSVSLALVLDVDGWLMAHSRSCTSEHQIAVTYYKYNYE